MPTDRLGEGQAGPSAFDWGPAINVIRTSGAPALAAQAVEALWAKDAALRASEAALAATEKTAREVQEHLRRLIPQRDTLLADLAEKDKLIESYKLSVRAQMANVKRAEALWLASRAEATKAEEALEKIAARPSGSFPAHALPTSDRFTHFHDGYHAMLHEAREALASIRAPQPPEPEKPKCQ